MPVTLDLPPKAHAESALGDPEAWVTAHGDVLLRFAMARVGDAETAEDLVQETLLAAWRGRAAFDGLCEPRTWLIAILKRRVADYYRRVGRFFGESLSSDAEVPCRTADAGAVPEAAEFWGVVTGCTGEMPEHLARAFRLRTFAEEDPAAICDAEGISRKNLSVRLHRARQLLRRCLENRWFGEE